ncbi:Fip1 motif-domain-containing protein [Protomyces lactucae-debilis]|uniref:Fip1 motif-domain-containing protein n=1 Tax=Protomyces lactucae-debilis TaxID=2754530 RepID=A0A1Y2F7P6_PROLT|nr:Fip1 motif-domain-containing protein [Protomyces lactucae-debilis]ORY79913.1 Fip1 motif-domain-containing protein [Protomyces lactucae-debilis]
MDDDLDDLYGYTSASPKADTSNQQEAQDVTMKEEEADKQSASGSGSSDDESEIEFVIATKPGQRAEPPANKPLPFSGAKVAKPAVAKPAVKAEDGAAAAAGAASTTQDVTDGSHTAGTTAAIGRKEPMQKLPNVDIHAIAQLDGKSILEIDLEALEHKPWRQEGADITDYFNYGFDEFTWTAYVNKQKQIRSEYTPDKVMANMLPDPMMMMPDPSMMGGFPGAMDPMFMQGMFNGQQDFPGQPPPFMPPQQQHNQQQPAFTGPASRAMQQNRPSHSPAPPPPAPGGFEEMPKIPTGPSKGRGGRSRR